MSTSASTFFGIVVDPVYQYKTLLKDALLLTRAVIDPSAQRDQTATLSLQINDGRGPLCQLDGSLVTTVPLNTQLHPGTDICFTVAGDSPIHVTGFYEPIAVEPQPAIVPAAFYLAGQ
jgi:hypothetical protein